MIHATISDFKNSWTDYFSDWRKLLHSTAWLIKFKSYCRYYYASYQIQCSRGNITLADIQKAKHDILIRVQECIFHDEMTRLKNGKPVKKDSRLVSLNPILDAGLLRLKVRLVSGNTNKCIVILPSRHHVTTLIICHYHETRGHVGAQQVLAAVREKYWILKGQSTVKRVIKGCIKCKSQHAPPCTQQMAPLLEEQMTPDKPSFSFVGIDHFGPLIVKAGRTHLKRCGCLFTCLTIRAVHLEVAHSLTADSFIAAFKLFTSRRRLPEKVSLTMEQILSRATKSCVNPYKNGIKKK